MAYRCYDGSMKKMSKAASKVRRAIKAWADPMEPGYTNPRPGGWVAVKAKGDWRPGPRFGPN